MNKEQNLGFIDRYIAEISDIGWYQQDFTNRKSVGQKIGKIIDISAKYREYVARESGAGIFAKKSVV